MHIPNPMPLLKNKHVLSISGNLGSAVLSFITFGMLARTLSKSTFGEWITFLTAFTFLELFRTSTLQTPLIRFYAGERVDNKTKIALAAWNISVRITLLFCFISLLLYFLIFQFNYSSWRILFIAIPAVYVASLPFNYALWLLQAKEKFGAILWIRVLNNASFLLLFIVCLLSNHISLLFVICSYTISCVITSVFTILKKWSPAFKYYPHDDEANRKLVRMGKFIMVTGVSSNLLKSSDTFLINIFLGPQAVAIYTTPQKILEVIELPLRSIVATAIPEMATGLKNSDSASVGFTLMRYSGVIFLLLIPVVLVCTLLSGFIVRIIGGNAYAGTAYILRLFLVFALLLPIERFFGVTLDIIGKPFLNLLKVVLMLAVNICGDVFCLYKFHNVASVAVSSILTFLVGIIVGHLMLRKFLPYTFRGIFLNGFAELRRILRRFVSR